MFALNRVFDHPTTGRLLKSDSYLIRNLIRDDASVLDLGCGSSSPVLRFSSPKEYVGVDAYSRSLDQIACSPSFTKLRHGRLLCEDILKVDFPNKSFDIVVLLDVIEHLPSEQGRNLLIRASEWAREVVFVTTPNGFLRQDPYDSNSYQEHLSGWTINEFQSLGFQKILGGGGPRFLRKREMQPDQWNHVAGSSVRWKPRLLWSSVSALAQIVTFRYPAISYQLHAFHYVGPMAGGQ